MYSCTYVTMNSLTANTFRYCVCTDVYSNAYERMHVSFQAVCWLLHRKCSPFMFIQTPKLFLVRQFESNALAG